MSALLIGCARLVHKPAIGTPIVGATAPAHITGATSSLDLELNDNDISIPERAYRPRLLSIFLSSYSQILGWSKWTGWTDRAA